MSTEPTITQTDVQRALQAVVDADLVIHAVAGMVTNQHREVSPAMTAIPGISEMLEGAAQAALSLVEELVKAGMYPEASATEVTTNDGAHVIVGIPR